MTRPMLAANEACDFSVLEHIQYPIYIQPKFDGVRCIVHSNVAYSRSMKPLPNALLQAELGVLPWELDGEITIPGAAFPAVQSFAMTRVATAEYRYVIFDQFNEQGSYEDRLKWLLCAEGLALFNRIEIVSSIMAPTREAVIAAYQYHLANGFEGVILRAPSGLYKQGRATLREATLLKLKPREDAEAVALEMLPLERNDNAPQLNELGLTKRSSSKAGKRPVDLLGSIKARVINGRFEGKEFYCGGGWTESEKKRLWIEGQALLGRTFTFTYSFDPGYELPRQPVFKAWRED